ncbi:MAG: hypothetical protein WC824_12570 [Bacteroidota bacterium]
MATNETQFRSFLLDSPELDWILNEIEKTFASEINQWNCVYQVNNSTLPLFGDVIFKRTELKIGATRLAFRITRRKPGVESYIMGTWFWLNGFWFNYNQVPEFQDTPENVRKRALGYLHRFHSLYEGLKKDPFLVVNLKAHAALTVSLKASGGFNALCHYEMLLENQEIVTLCFCKDGRVMCQGTHKGNLVWKELLGMESFQGRFEANQMEFVSANTDPGMLKLDG